MKRRISAIQQIDGTLLGVVLSVIYLRRKVKKLRWEGDAREGGVENSKSGTKVQTILSAGLMLNALQQASTSPASGRFLSLAPENQSRICRYSSQVLCLRHERELET
jgi:hypothetical protein